jgi:outer membrane protein assembly factor BamB
MTNVTSFRVVLMLAAAVAVSGCGILGKSRPKTPVLGERIPVLTSEGDVQVDAATAAMPMALPAPVANTEWAQSGGNAAKSVGHVALGTTLNRAFTVQAGRGSSLTARLASEPVAAEGRVFTIDTLGAVRAFDGQTGAQIWASQTPFEVRDNTPSLYGGGIAYDSGRIYATNGLGYVAALDARTGVIVWKVRPGGPLRGAPTVANDAVYVMSQDNQIYSLKTTDGSTNWSQAAALEIAGVFGSASPAVGQGTVVGGFSSGELNAYRYENGRMVWQDALQRTSIRTSVSSLSDIDADPVIDRGQVIAVGQGGRMVALELTTGQRQWELNVAGIATPWVAGDWVFVDTDDGKLLSIARSNGRIRWIYQLPQFERAKSKKGQIDYKGPILAGGRLIVVGSNGVIVSLDPVTGSFQSQTSAGAGISLAPIVANSTLYIYDDAGRLSAYR